MFKKIAIVADHRGEKYKKIVAQALEDQKIDYCLPQYDQKVDNDYPDVIKSVYELYVNKQIDGIILLCGTGIGMMIGANKCKNIRCVWASSPDLAAFGRIHEDCNALAMPAGYSDQESGYCVKISPQKIKQIVAAFVSTSFGGGRHQKRVEKLNNLQR